MSFVRTAVTVMGGRTSTGRVVAVALLAPVLLAAGVTALAGPAAADDEPTRQGGATATLEGLQTHGQAVVHEDGEELTTGAGLFEMAVDGGGTLQTYGTDVDNPTQQQARYGETDWEQTSLHDNRHAGKILWILRHSYPQVNDLQTLAKSSKSGQLSPQTAAAGTQVAIWRYSDAAGDVEVNAVDPAAEKLADHLQREARTMREPKASISLDAAGVSRAADGRLGPVTVRTGAPSVALSPASDSGSGSGFGSVSQGVRVVGRNGQPVDSARDGARLYLEVPDKNKAGSASLTVQAATKVPVGRAFTGAGGHARSQTQILAGSSQSTVSATATVSWDEDGAIPAVTAEKNCSKGGVSITVANTGNRPFGFRLADRDREVAAASSETITVPVGEDQAYRIPFSGPDGRKPGAAAKAFTGVLDCATRSAAASQDVSGITPQSHPATAGGDEAGTDGAEGGGDLAETGASDTPLVLGIAVGLVILGAVAVLSVRRRKPADGEQ